MRLQDYGELIVSLTVGILLTAILAWSYFRGSSDFRKISRDMILFTVALIFCGVFIDMVGIAVSMGWAIEQSLQILEDGGEMVVLSLILCYVFTRIRMDKQNGKSNMTIQSGLSSQ